MKINKLLILLTVTGFLALYGCDSDDPVKEVGDTISESVEDAGEVISEAAQDACDEVGDATDSNVDC